MACLGITIKNRQPFCCRNFATNDSYFCASHNTLTPEVLKQRWIRLYLRFCKYSYRDEKGAEHVLAPLRAGIFTLTREDILAIHSNRLGALDTYLLLLREGYCEPVDNIVYFLRSILYCLNLVSLQAATHPLLALLKEVFFNTSMKLYETSVHAILSLSSSTSPANHKAYGLHPETQVLLREITDTEIAHQWAWTNPKERLEKFFGDEPKPAEEMVHFMRTVFFPCIDRIYMEGKQVQKMRIDSVKKELMAVCWHPDRVMKYMEMGFDMDGDGDF